MSYDIEVRQSRFPNALDPTLTEEIHAPRFSAGVQGQDA